MSQPSRSMSVWPARSAGCASAIELEILRPSSPWPAARSTHGVPPRARAFAIEARSVSASGAAAAANAYAVTYMDLRRQQGVNDANRAAQLLLSKVVELQHQLDAATGPTSAARREVLTSQQSA